VRDAWHGPRPVRIAAGVLAVLPALACARVELHAYATRDWHSATNAGTAQILPVLRWSHEHVKPDDVVLSEGEPVLALYEGFHAQPPISFTAREYLVPPGGDDGARRLVEMLSSVNARYVVLLNPAMIQSAGLLANSHPSLHPVQRFPTATAYEVAP
jgi:hypothetical protein